MSGYVMFINDTQMPITPGKLQLKIKGANKTLTLVNDGEINFLRMPGLTEITVPLLLPMLESYSGSAVRSPAEYLQLFEDIVSSLGPARFILSRTSPDGRRLYDTNMKVSIESYTVDEDAGNGLDVSVSLNMKLYKDFGTKTVTVIQPTVLSAPALTVSKARESSSAPKGPHTVKAGDSLWAIAQRYYNNGALYPKIYEANKELMDDVNLRYHMPTYTIYPGQVLTIP